MRGFEYLKDLYANDANFSDVYMACDKAALGKFYKNDGYLFKESKLCVPNCSMRELLLREAHGGRLMGHFSVRKTLEETSLEYVVGTLHVERPILRFYHMGCLYPYPFLVSHG
jgi:hypothetical protein